MSFEVEIRNSLKSMQSQVIAVQGSTDRLNTSLATTQTRVAALATGHRTAAGAANEHARAAGGIGTSIGKIGQAANAAGGSAGGLVTKLVGMAAFNPVALIVGASIGFITGKLAEMIGASGKATEALGKIRLAAADGAAAFESKTLGEADTHGNASAALDEAMGGDMAGVPPAMIDAVRKAAGIAERSGKARDQGEAVRRIIKSGLLERGGGMNGPTAPASVNALAAIGMNMEDANPDDLAAKVSIIGGSARGQSDARARSIKQSRQARSDVSDSKDLESAAGFNTTGRDQTYAAIAGSPEVSRQLDELNKNIREQTAIMKADQARTGWRFNNPFATSSAEKVQEAISARDAYLSGVSSATR